MDCWGEKAGIDTASLMSTKSAPAAPKPVAVDPNLDKKIAAALKDVQSEPEGTPLYRSHKARLDSLQKQKAQQQAAPDAEAKSKADQDFNDALSDLSMILTKGVRKNMMPEQEQAMLPVLTRLMDAAFRKATTSLKKRPSL